MDSITAKSLGNIWHIFEYDNTIYFTTDALILKYSSGRFTVIDPLGHIDCAFMSRGTLYLAVDGSLKFLMGETIRDCYNCDILKNKMLRGFASYHSGILVLSENEGLYYYDGQHCTPFATEADKILKSSMSFCIAENDRQWAVGTVKSGIAVIDKKTLAVERIDINTSLSENTVISLAFSTDGSLWAGLNCGIDHILLGQPISCICPQNYVGIGYDAAVGDSCMHLATNRGVFFAKFTKNNYPELTPLDDLDGQAWGFYKAFGNLYLLHDKGLYRIDGKKAYSQGGIKGFWGMVQIDDSTALTATYSELYAAQLKKDGSLDFVRQPLDGSYYNMVCADDYIWLHSKGGLNCVRAKYLKSDRQLYDFKHFNIDDGLPNDKTFRLQVIDGKVCAMSASGVFEFEFQSQRFIKIDSIAGLDCRDGLRAVSQSSNVSIGLKDNLIKVNKNGKQSAYYLDNAFVCLHSMTPPPVFVEDTIAVISNINGFSLTRLGSENIQTTKNLISKVFIGGSLAWRSNYPDKKYVPVSPYSSSDIKFVLFGTQDSDKFSFRLNNGKWSEPAFFRSKEFTSLKEGRYSFQIRQIDLSGNQIIEDSFDFIILPPWYRTWWAYVLYLLTFAAIVMLITRIVRRHYHNKQLKIEEKNREDIQRLELQHEKESAADKLRISELEKQKLKDDLDHKTTELGDMALSLAGKNEILDTLKSDIADIVKNNTLAPALKQKLSEINTKIDNNIQNDKLIDRFEEQFNLLHNNFIKKLKTLYPELSRNDYMLCAYIRMELSTKEIAQMLNMSVRGVESQKYRLKKKINLDTDLNEYLKSVENQE